MVLQFGVYQADYTVYLFDLLITLITHAARGGGGGGFRTFLLRSLSHPLSLMSLPPLRLSLSLALTLSSPSLFSYFQT